MRTHLLTKRGSFGNNILPGNTENAQAGSKLPFLLFFLFSLLCVSTSFGQISNTGLKSPTTNALATAGTNPTNAYSSNNSYAVFDANAETVRYGGFGLTGIPANAVITGIEVLFEANRANDRDLTVSLTWNNGTNFTTGVLLPDVATTDTFVLLGGALDNWGRTWTIAELADANFGVRCTVPALATGALNLDHLQVRVHYYTGTLSAFTTSGTFTVPAGVTTATADVWGAGAGGSNASTAAGGGGAGAFSRGVFTGVSGASSITVTVGTGGAAGAPTAAPGNFSRATLGANSVTANGGLSTNNRNGGVGGTASAISGVTTVSFAGGAGGNGRASTSNNANEAGGGGGGSALTNAAGGVGATGADDDNVQPSGGVGTGYGGGGATADGSPSASAGRFPGGGGGGRGEGASTSGAGANGAVYFTYTCPTYSITSVAALSPVCASSPNSTITVTGGAGLPDGTYTVTYNRSAPAATGLTATMTATSGSGTFNVSGFSNGATFTVTNLTSVNCSSNISTGNVSNAVTINAVATAAAGSNMSVCYTGGAISITAGSSASNNSGITWTSSGTGTFADANSLTLATYTPSPADLTAGSVVLTLTATGNSPCSNATSNKTLTMAQTPTASAGGSATICSNQTAVVSGASSSNGTINWTENGTGSITAGQGTLTPTYTPGVGETATVTLTMTVSNNPCTAATATYTVNVVGAATANAGTALTMCETAGSVNVTAGSTSTNNAGITWSSSGTGTWADANSMTLATYTPSAADMDAGSVTITLTATGNTPCGNAVSNKTLTLYKQPTATAGGSQTICQNQSATVSGATSSNGTILWTENGAGSIQAGTQTTLTPTYNAAAGDAGNTVTLTMTVSNGTCTPATATYTVSVLALPTAAAGLNFNTCANSGAVNVASGSSASNYSSVLWTSSGTGTFTDDNSLTLATYTPSAADISNGTVTLTLTAFGNGSCNNATSNKVLTILPIPVAVGAFICQGTASVPMTSATVCPNNAPVTTAVRYPTSGANSGTGTAWNNPGNVISDNNSNASFTGSTSNNVTSQVLNATGYGFSIPANAVITGIQSTIGRSRSGGISGDVQDNSVRLLKAGTAVGDNKGFTSTNWGTGESAINYGGTTDTWNTTWSAAEVNAANFGVAFVVDISQGFIAARTANVDYINLSITYYIPGELNWYTVSSGGSSIGTGSSFNPVGVAGSGLANTNTPGTTTYYVECSTVAGCRTPVDYVINELPEVSFSGLNAVYCEDETANLLANHAGGTFSGAGITDNGNGTATFNAAVAGVGPHSIMYTYTDGNTCVNSTSQNVTVNANVTYYADADSDGFGDLATPLVSCLGAPAGFVLDSTDCNDANNAIHATFPFYVDGDGDGFGAGSLVSVCAVDANTPPANYSLNNTDCDDADNTKNATFPFYVDADGDTYGAGSAENLCAVDAHTPPMANYSVNNTDCDDADNTKHMTFPFYVDADLDGYGDDSAAPTSLCAVDAMTSPTAGFVVDNTDCDDTKATVHPNATEIGYNLIDDDCDGSIDEGFPPKVTNIQGAFCNVTLANIDTQIIANAVAGAQGYRWRVTTLNGPNVGQVQFLDTAIRSMKLTQLATYAFNTQYKIELGVYFAGFLQPYTTSNCVVSTPATLTQLISCGAVMTSMSDPVYATMVPFAAGYRFKITDPVNPLDTQNIDRPIRDFRMSMVTAFVVQYGKTYNVEVAVKNTDGTYLPFGGVCTVTTPVFPTTSVQDSQCDDYAVPSNATQIYAFSYPGAIAYVFQLMGPGLPIGGAEVTKSVRTFTLNDFPGLIPGASYNVRVRLVFNVADPVGPFGKTCTIVTPGALRAVATKADFNAVAFPNPFAEQFNIDVVSSQDHDINVKVYDMTGRLLETRNVKASAMESMQLGESYPSGVYNVIVSQGENVKTLRVIKR